MVKVYTNNGKAIMVDNGNEVELTQISIDPKTKKVKWVLPENSSNRKYLDQEILNKKGEMTLEYKETRILGERTTNTNPTKTTKGWMEYMTDEEKQVVEAIMNKCKNRKLKADILAQIAECNEQLANLDD